MSARRTLKHLIIPHEGNNYRARLLHNNILALIILVFLGFQYFSKTAVDVTHNTLGYASQISVDEVIRLTNEKRQANGLNPVTANTALAKAALAKGQDMLAKGYWAHVSPDGTEPWTFFRNAGYKYRYAGENLARDFSSAGSAIEAWMASPSHKENMLSSRYKEIGVAVVEGSLAGRDATIIVQLFGTAAADSIVAPVAAANPPSTVAQAVEEEKPEVQKAITESLPKVNIQGVSLSPQINSYDVGRIVSLGLLTGLVFLFVIDAFVLYRRNLVRGAGRPLAHLSVLGIGILILFIIKAGQII